ncbi:IclR family transcriptional regulator [Bradyrhizobium valentinum]|nr:IclR family transcriptional regulator [Bradyrhizobium valentinum]
MGAIENAAEVLRLFGPGRLEMSVTDVSQLLRMPKSSASRLLKTMLQEGLLSRSENPPRYKVGNLLFEISRLYKLNSSLIDAVDEAVREISRETGHTGYVSILDGADVLVIRMHQGSHALRVFTPLGQRAPAFATALGRSLLARLSDDVVRSLHDEGVIPPSPRAPQSVDQLLTALDQPRRFGWAEAADEAIPGVGSISVSVADPEIGETVGFCISYPASHLSDEERSRMITLLTTAAQRIASRFGDPFLSQRAHRVLGGGSTAA